MSMKKKIKLLVLAAVYLGVCWGIGQFRQPKNSVDSQTADQNMPSADRETAEVWKRVVFDGNQKTDDTPWGMTAGWFEMEKEGNCILLLPDTAAIIEISEEDENVSFACQIHPWVKESSDGAGLLICICSADEKVLREEEIQIGNTDGWTEHITDLTEYPEAAVLKLSCNNGKNDNDSCDWVVLKPQG